MSGPELRCGLRRVAVVVLAALSLATVGWSSGTASTPPATPHELPAVPDVNRRARSELAAGGVLRLPVTTFGSNWNTATPVGSAADIAAVVAPMSYTPWRFDAGGQAALDTDYVVAFDASADHLVHTYTLNPAAHWHGGDPITAADWIADWQAKRGADASFTTVSTDGYELISSVVAGDDEFEVVVTYDVAYPDYQRLFFLQGPAESVADAATFNAGWVGAPRDDWFTGPFRIGSYDEQAGVLELVPDETWWGDAPLLGAIRFARYVDRGAIAPAFAAGELDAFDVGPDADVFAAVAATAGAEVRAAAGPSWRQITFNAGPGGGLLQQPAVRQAIQLGLDRSAIAASDLAGLPWPATALGSHVVVESSPYDADNSAEWGAFDPDRARAVLEGDGWELGADGFYERGGERLTVTFSVLDGVAESANEAAEVAAQLDRIGIDVTIRVQPLETWSSALAAGDFELIAFSVVGTRFPFAALDQLYGDGRPGNFGHSTIPELTPLLRELSTTWEPADRATIAGEIDRLLWERGHSIPLYQRPELIAVRSSLANFGAFGNSSVVWQDVGYVGAEPSGLHGRGSRQAAIVPQPTTTAPQHTVAPTRPPVTRPPSSSTTPTTSTPPETRPPTTSPATTGTTTVPPGTTTSLPTTSPPTSSAPAPPTAAPPTAAPATSPPVTAAIEVSTTTEPPTAPFVMSSPVVVDAEDPAPKPPVIVDVAVTCPDLAAVTVLVQNVDTFHYPAPFPAIYAWTLADDVSTVDSGVLQLTGLEFGVSIAETVAAGTYTFTVTVTDADLDVAAATDLVVADCGSLPAPSPDPLPPVVIVSSVTCVSLDFSGWVGFAVQNDGPDDGGARPYEYDVVALETQTQVDAGNIADVPDGGWATRQATGLNAGTYLLGVVDSLDPDLAAYVEVDVPACPPPPPPEFPAHSLDFTFLGVSTKCAVPPGADGSAHVHVLDHIPLTADAYDNYEVTVAQGDDVVLSFAGGWTGPGTHSLYLFDLAVGDYEMTVTTSDPFDSATPPVAHGVTFTVGICPGPVPGQDEPHVWGISTQCLAGDDTETLFYFVDHPFQPSPIHWAVKQADTDVVGSDGPTFLDGADDNLRIVRGLPAGDGYTIVVTSDGGNHPSVESSPFAIHECAQPVDPADSTEPPPDDTAPPPDDTELAEPGDTEPPVDGPNGTEPAVPTGDHPDGGGVITIHGSVDQHAP